ncbi:MAG TPA: S-methyl-5'-thioadenosine phosphorylase [Verrucomicrobiae bacterium]|nr:S-methyl-5'-thioadenosine phosphorylase [Verrucomicrobiae bacterium]
MKTGIIGGSGLYEMEGIERKRWNRVTTPFGKPSDEYLTGRIGEREVVFLPRHGRGHSILPSELNHRANIYGMKKLGVSHIISISAVGSLKEEYQPTDIVVIDQFFDRTKRSREFTFFGDGMVAHIAFADPVCLRMQQMLATCARDAGATVHVGGTYVNMEGPAFSTRAESRFHRQMGWDVIGMTNYGEARCAREAEICYATLAMVTDYDCWHEAHEAVTVEMVVANLRKNSKTAQEIIRRTVVRLDPGADCTCRHALATAIMTHTRVLKPATRKKLGLLLEKYSQAK